MKKIILSFLFICVSYGVFAVDTITIINILGSNYQPQNNFCHSSYIIININSNMALGTFFTVRLKLNGKIVKTSTEASNYISIQIPDFPTIENASNYKIDVVSSNVISAESNNIGIGVQYIATITDGLIVKSDDFNYDYICPGSNKKYYAEVKDCNGNIITDGISYQWKSGNVNITGETNDNITINTNYGSLTYTAFINGIEIYSKQIVPQFSNTDIYFTINEEYSNENCVGSNKKILTTYFSNTASFSWSKDGIILPNTNKRFYLANDNGNYNVTITEPNCTFITTPISVNFNDGLLNSIGTAIGDTTICEGKPITIFAKNKNNLYPSLKYQWQKDGVNISLSENSNANNYYIKVSNEGNYNVIYQQGACITKSKNISITNSSKAQKPIITYKDAFEICKGGIRINQANKNLFGQWYKDGIAIENYFSNEYVATQSGIYKMVYGTGVCEIESNEITLNFASSVLPVLTSYRSNLCGSNSYAVIGINTDNMPGIRDFFNFQWKKDGININGQTDSYILPQQPGNYTVQMSNNICSNISNSIEVTNSNLNEKIASTSTIANCSNQLVRLYFIPGNYFLGDAAPSYIWKLNGNIINTGEDRSIYASKGGVYTVDYNNNGCVGTSAPFVLSANDVPKPPIVNPQIINYGNSATLSATGCDGTVNWYNVSSGGTSLGIGDNFTTPIINSASKFYAECTNASCTSIIRKEVLVSICENYSLKSGSWIDPTVWSCGLIPNFGTNVTISNGHNIVVPLGIHEVKNIKLEGTVNFETGGEIKLNN